jgi:hypothetical protein
MILIASLTLLFFSLIKYKYLILFWSILSENLILINLKSALTSMTFFVYGDGYLRKQASLQNLLYLISSVNFTVLFLNSSLTTFYSSVNLISFYTLYSHASNKSCLFLYGKTSIQGCLDWMIIFYWMWLFPEMLSLNASPIFLTSYWAIFY